MKAQKEFGKKYSCINDCGYVVLISETMEAVNFIDKYHFTWGNGMGGYSANSIIECLEMENLNDYKIVTHIFYYLRLFSHYSNEARG